MQSHQVNSKWFVKQMLDICPENQFDFKVVGNLIHLEVREKLRRTFSIKVLARGCALKEVAAKVHNPIWPVELHWPALVLPCGLICVCALAGKGDILPIFELV